MNTDLKMVEETVRALRNLSVEFDISVVKTNHADISRLLWRAADKINALQTQLAESQRREQAAIKDIELLDDRGTLCRWRDGGACTKNGRQNVCTRGTCAANACKQMDWRGPREARKGEAVR